MKKHIRKTPPEEVQAIVTCQSKKFATKFNIKDKTEIYHQSSLFYYGKCPNQSCTEDYIGETDHRIKEKITVHNKRDKNSHILKDSRGESYIHVCDKDFKVLANNYRSALNGRLVKIY